MKLEMTERDKKLLIMLSVFVIVVCIGYWGIYPVIKEIKSTSEQIEEEEETKQAYEQMIAEVPMLEADKEAWEEEIETARESFFAMMDSAEIDKYFTSMVLGYNLESYDLTIAISEEETSLEPYQYSARATGESDLTDYSEEEAESGSAAELSQIEAAEEAGGVSDDDEEDDSSELTAEVTTGIYEANVTMRLGGDEADLQRLIEDLSASEIKLKLSSYSWSEEKTITDMTEDGEYDVETEHVLTISVQIFMYREELSDTDSLSDDVSVEETEDGDEE